MTTQQVGTATAADQSGPRLAFLAEAGRVLGASLDYRQTLQGLSELGLGVLGGVCLVGMLDEGGDVHIVAGAHIDPAKRSVIEGLRGVTAAHRSPTAGVVRTGRSCVLAAVDEATMCLTEEARLLVGQLECGPTIIVPLVVRRRTIGALLFSRLPGCAPYEPADVALAEEIARRAAAAVDNARAFTNTSVVAHTLQQSLLPPRLPTIPGVDLAARYQPASQYMDVGGDFYDAFDLHDGRWGLLLGDVAGKGPAAAAATAIVRYTARAAARFGPSLGVPAAVNEALLETDDDENFCTLTYAEFEPSGDGVTVSLLNCGHPLPLLARAGGEVRELQSSGSLLGQFADPEVGVATVALQRGDMLVFVTDGVLEARAPRSDADSEKLALFGSEGLVDTVTAVRHQSAAAVARAVQEAAVKFAGGSLGDDLAVLVLRCEPMLDRERPWPPCDGDA